MSIKLIIGDYSKSSWSLRAWLVLVTADVSFQTVQLMLEKSDTHETILKYSPSAKLPALITGDMVINDSLAIAEYIAELYPNAGLWPEQQNVRAMARAASAEMHSGFTHLRTQLSFGLATGETPDVLTQETKDEIKRIFDIWTTLITLSGSSDFLCGRFGIVDAMFVPVVFRLRRYGIAVPTQLQAYVAKVLNYPAVQRWLTLAAKVA